MRGEYASMGGLTFFGAACSALRLAARACAVMALVFGGDLQRSILTALGPENNIPCFLYSSRRE